MPSLLPDPSPLEGSIATAQITIIDQNDGIFADVTVANFSILTSLTGTPFPTAFNDAAGNFTVRSGKIEITSSEAIVLSVVETNMSVTLNTSNNSPISGELKGYFRITGISADKGHADIIATYKGQTFVKRIYAAKVKSESGGSPSTIFASTSSFYNLTWSSAFQQAAATLDIGVSGFGVVEVSVEGHHTAVDAVLEGQIQAFRESLPGWINVSPPVATIYTGGSFAGRYVLNIGPFTTSEVIIPGEPQNVQFRLLVRRISGTGNPTWMPAHPQTFAVFWRSV
jgi:hypothetical protein